MAIITHLAKTGRTAAAELQSTMQGEVSLPHDENFDRNHPNPRLLSNGTEDNLPAVIARCETRRDIQSALRTARAHGLAVIVRGVEHGYSGRALKPGELVADLSAMRQVAVHPDTRVAIVAGGATVKDVVTAAAAHGLAAVTGICSSARMASLKLDGGYGPLIGRYGLAADNVLEAEIVLKSGQHVIANADRNRDLFRALCVGGADFGVVTSLHVQLRALPSLLAGMIFYAWSDADMVLRGYSALAALAPDYLTISAGIVSAVDGNPLLFIAPTWCGEREEGARVLAALQSFGNPLAAIVGPMSYPNLLAMHDRYIAKGPRYSTHRRYLPALTDRAISAMIIAANARTSPLSAIVLHHFRGAATRARSEAGAFGVRNEHFLLEAIAAWEPAADDQGLGHRLWAQNLSDVLAPTVLLRDYANPFELDNHADR
jgi:FAD binding domain